MTEASNCFTARQYPCFNCVHNQSVFRTEGCELGSTAYSNNCPYFKCKQLKDDGFCYLKHNTKCSGVFETSNTIVLNKQADFSRIEINCKLSTDKSITQ